MSIQQSKCRIEYPCGHFIDDPCAHFEKAVGLAPCTCKHFDNISKCTHQQARIDSLTRELAKVQDSEKEYEVWMEGFRCTGECSGAMYKGKTKAKSFEEACDIICGSEAQYDSERGSVWNCKLYDNEADARKYYG